VYEKDTNCNREVVFLKLQLTEMTKRTERRQQVRVAITFLPHKMLLRRFARDLR
jgi:hypothetical protein